MNQILADRFAAGRARWLAELAQVLDEAQELVNCLAVAKGPCLETLDACARLEAARTEVRSLRRGRPVEAVKEIDPDWIKQVLWDRVGGRARLIVVDR